MEEITETKTLKEKILNMPAWKAFIAVALLLFFFVTSIEVLLVHTVFHTLNKAADQFEKIDKEDKADLDNMEKDFEKNEKKDHVS